MALVRLNTAVNIPSIGDRPPLVSFATEIKVNALHALLGGVIAAAIVWVAVGTPLPARRQPIDELEERDVVVPGRFSRTP